jgi:putative flavoprotein involved in K+ transport
MTSTAQATDVVTRTETWLAGFNDALAARDIPRVAAMFAPESFWRDLISFTWNIVTVENPAGIALMLSECLDRIDPSGFHLTEPPTSDGGVITAWIAFSTAVGRGSGLLRLTDAGAWTLLTTLDELTGHEEPAGAGRPKGTEHGADRARQTYAQRRAAEAAELGYAVQPYVLVVGGGQGGIALGARLRQLDVPTIVIDKHDRPGGQWRERYSSLCLHDPVWYDHLPYLKFPANWPVFSPKDKIADWLESYTRIMEINYWSNTEAKHARYDEATQEWVVEVERDGNRWCSGPSNWCWPPGCPASRTCRHSPAWTASAGSSTTPAPIRARTPGRANEQWSSGPTTPRSTSAVHSGSPAPTSRWCSAPRRTSCARRRCWTSPSRRCTRRRRWPPV